MFAAIFEVQPEQGKFDEYLSLAEFLHPKLEAIDDKLGAFAAYSESDVFRAIGNDL